MLGVLLLVLVALPAAGEDAGPAPVTNAGPASIEDATADAAPRSRGGVPKPRIRFDPIPYRSKRKRQMANYSKRHYGRRSWPLENPRAIVLHYTATSSYPPVHNTFAANSPSLGERPGVCAQFVVDKDGTIYQLTRLGVRCRHAIGLNHLSFGIEMVQQELGGRNASTHAILDRGRQSRSATRLAAWLRQRYRIPSRDLIGHAMANDSHLFKDLEGWRNDHTDWRRSDVAVFRKRVNRIIRAHRRQADASTGAPPSGRAVAEAEAERLRFGRSAGGRPLVARRLGDPSSARTVLIVGEIHGDEPAGRSVVRRLRRRPGALRSVDAWTVLSLNPDGHADDRRTNARGVDLNRNFAVGWSGSEPRGSGYYGGPHPFSELESRALRRLVRRIDPDLTIHYHQPWGAVLLPCAGPAPQQRRYARISGLPVDRCRGQRLAGTATRWQNERGGTAFVVELGPGRLRASQLRRHARAAARVGSG